MDNIEQKVIEAAKKYYDVNTDEEAREELITEWGKYGPRGYAPFTGGVCTKDGKEPQYIAKLDDFDIYDTDLEAAKQAEKDGIKLIPYKIQPKYDCCRYVRFIDTPKNRKILGIN